MPFSIPLTSVPVLAWPQLILFYSIVLCFPALLVIFNWMPAIINFTLLNVECFCSLVNIFEFHSGLQLEMTYEQLAPFRSCFYELTGRSRA